MGKGPRRECASSERDRSEVQQRRSNVKNISREEKNTLHLTILGCRSSYLDFGLTMEKYFQTLDNVGRLFHVEQSKTVDKKELKVLRRALDGQWNAGPEANYIIREWKKERGYE